MAHDYPKIDPAQHQQIFNDKILRDPDYLNASGQERPRAIITAGQPGAGKGSLVDAAKLEMNFNAVVVDPDRLRDLHPQVDALRQQHPYTWSTHTHGDASQWATELLDAGIVERKNIILDTTAPRADVIKDLQARGYDVEIRAIATHRLESELGVDNRFSTHLDEYGHGRYVPKEVRGDVYQKLPGALDEVAKQTGVPIQIYDREGRLHFDSRTSCGRSFSLSPLFSCLWRLDFGSLALLFSSPGRALKSARNARLTKARLNDLQHAADAQRKWHRELPDRLQQGTPSHATQDRTH